MSGRRLALAALLVLGLAGCGGNAPLARIGDHAVTKADVTRLVEHGREEAKREGRDFPSAGSAGYRDLEHQALAILASRAQLVEAARRLGVRVSDSEIRRRVIFPHKELIETLYEGARQHLGIPEQNEKGSSALLAAEEIRVELTLQKVQQRLGAKRFDAWVAHARTLPVRYAAGWQP